MTKAATNSRASDTRAHWRRLCDVDPELRSLGFYDDLPASKLNCGAAVAALEYYTGALVAPQSISGRPISKRVTGDTAIVKTAGYDPGTSATVNVLVIKRGDDWWLATPQAINAAVAAKGGLSEAKLRSEFRRLRAASRRRP